MRTIHDCFGREVRLTDERLVHILEHPEMSDLVNQIGDTLANPEIVRRSNSDDTVELYYRFYTRTTIGGKWMCVVVKYRVADAFVITAYLTDRPKPGDDLWPTK